MILQPGTSQCVTSSKTADSPDTRMLQPPASPPLTHPPHSSRLVPFDDSPLRNCPIRDIAITERDKQLLADLRRVSVMSMPRCRVSRYATAWAECLEGASSGHQSWAVLCRYRCRLLLAEIPKGSDRNAELKHRLQLWRAGEIHELVGRVLGQQHSGPLRRRKRTVQQQTDEQCGRRACALTATGSISGAVKGLLGGAAQGSADCRKNKRSSGSGTHPTSTECAEAERVAWRGGRYKAARGARREHFGDSTPSPLSGRQASCRKNVDACSTRNGCS